MWLNVSQHLSVDVDIFICKDACHKQVKIVNWDKIVDFFFPCQHSFKAMLSVKLLSILLLFFLVSLNFSEDILKTKIM